MTIARHDFVLVDSMSHSLNFSLSVNLHYYASEITDMWRLYEGYRWVLLQGKGGYPSPSAHLLQSNVTNITVEIFIHPNQWALASRLSGQRNGDARKKFS